MRKLWKKMKNKQGFTLMEMLIVVAIIAVLVAIAIPVYQGQVHKAKVAADMGERESVLCGVTGGLLTDQERSVQIQRFHIYNFTQGLPL